LTTTETRAFWGLRTLTNGTWLPLICADEERVKQMYPIAEAITEEAKKPYRVLQFLVRVDVTEDVVKKFGK
jgi:hypothetical protein